MGRQGRPADRCWPSVRPQRQARCRPDAGPVLATDTYGGALRKGRGRESAFAVRESWGRGGVEGGGCGQLQVRKEESLKMQSAHHSPFMVINCSDK